MKRATLMLAAVALLLGIEREAMADPIPVANFSFEEPALPEGFFTDGETSPPGWTLSGNGGVFYPQKGLEADSVPDGHQVAFVNFNPAFGTGSSLFQDVGVPVTDGATYKLDVFVGRVKFGYAAHYLVELLAGSTVIGSASGTISPGTGHEVFFNVEVAAVGAGSGDLGIRLSETGPGNPNFAQTLFDDVRLKSSVTSPVPEPSSLALLGTAFFTGLGYFGWRRRKLAAA